MTRVRVTRMTPTQILAICRDEWPVLRWRWAEVLRCFIGRGRGGLEVQVLHLGGKSYVYIDVYVGPRFVDGSPPVPLARLRDNLREARRTMNKDTP